MSDRERERASRLQCLVDELWPTPAPPPDMAERVLAALAAGSGAPPRSAAAPAPPRRSVRARATATVASMAAAAATLLIAGWWASARFHGGAPSTQDQQGDIALPGQPDGQAVASTRQTVAIGGRAAAAMEPGAQLAWSVRGKRARVEQRRGSVFYRVERGGPFHVSTPAGEVEVTGTCFRVVLGALDTTLVSVLEGGVAVRTEAGTLALGVGQTARLRKGQPPEVVPSAADGIEHAASAEQLQERVLRAEEQVRELERQLAERAPPEADEPALRPRAALMLPMSSRLSVYGSRADLPRDVSLSLPRAARAGRAAVEVARDAEFKQGIFRGPVGTAYVTVPAPERGDLYWRIVGDPAAAGHARFLPDPHGAGPAPGAPRNLVSDGRQNTTIYFQSAPPALTLAFAAAPEASRYRVRIYRASALAHPVFERVVREARCSVEAGLLGEGSYVWSALPLDEQGRELGGGRLAKLELVYDNALAALAISEPRPGQRIAGSAVNVLGVAPLGARLFVNGRPARLDAKGRFALKVTGAPRVLVFRLLGRDGAESYWIRQLKSRS